MPNKVDVPPKSHQTGQQKQQRTDDAFSEIQPSEKRNRDIKTARLKEARLNQEAEGKTAASQKKPVRKTTSE